MASGNTRSDREILADMIQRIGAKPREAKFDNEGKLIKLNLAGLNLTDWPPEIWQCRNLQTLILGEYFHDKQKDEWMVLGNQLRTLPPDITNLTNLQILSLSNNQLTVLPPELGQLTALQSLSLFDNQLTVLPPELTQLTALQSLDLGFNQLTALPPELTQLTALQSLNLFNNQLTVLPPELTQLTALQSLNLGSNQLTALPPELTQLTALQSLSLSGNQLTVLPPELTQLTALQELDLSNNQLTVLPPELTQLTALQSLNLGSNQLTVLPPELTQLTALQSLSLSGNQLTVLPPELTQLTALQSLSLGFNQLTVLPPELTQLTALQSLSLSSNQLTVLPPELGQLTALQSLSLGFNQLTVLPPELTQLTALQSLNLGSNQLTALPPELTQLTALQSLSLFNNQLTVLPPELTQLTALQSLNLGSNQLTALPPELTQLTALQELDLSNNQLTVLPPELTQLTALQSLSLSGNQLTVLPPELGQLTALQSLNLGSNQLTALPPELTQLTALQELDLSNNQLTVLPPELTQLTALQSLSLYGNQLTALPPELTQLTALQSLSLYDNQLTVLPPELTQLTALQSLSLFKNQLTVLPPELTQLTALQSLSLSGNQLTVLPLELGNLDLRILELEDNPFKTPPPEIVARGTDDVLDFLRELKKGSLTRYEAKLLIVGQGDIGKTCLLRALRGEPFIEGLPTTHGIDIRPYCLPHPKKPDTTLMLNVWDFGGQQIYHTSHQFFMTKRSLYLLVWNARGDQEQARLDHWLRNIQAIAPDARVLLVATHIDERPADIHYERLKAAYPKLAGHIGVSNKTRENIDELKAMIAREAADLLLMEQQWPTTWINAETALREHPKYHIDLEEYTEICMKHGLSADIAQTALGGYLHDLGKILYYQDDDTLSNFIVLKPNWLTQTVSRVLDDPVTRQNKGILNHSDFPRIWDKDDNGQPYERRLYPCFLKLTERFLMSYELEPTQHNQQDKRSLVPLLLPHTPPEDMPPWSEMLPGQPEINMRFYLQHFVPPGLMSWVIVLTQLYSKNVYWREGVRLHYEGHEAHIELNPSTHELWLHVKGPAPSNFFNILQHTINDRILKRYFEGLQYRREIPCNCHIKRGDETLCTHFHDYERLAERMKRKVLTAECNESFEQVSVPELLEGIHYSTDDRVVEKLEKTQETLELLVKEHGTIIEITSENQDLLTQNAQMFEQLNRSFSRLWNLHTASLQVECPNTFLLMPGDRNKFNPKKRFNTEYTMYLLCQHPAGPHLVKGETGYPVRQPEEWWAELAPWLKRLTDYLRYIPKSKALIEAYDEYFYKEIKTSLSVFESVTNNLPAISADDPGRHFRSSSSRFEPHEVEGPALRALYSFLLEADKQKHWGGLYKTPTHDGNIFWLCEEHRKLYI